MGSKRQIKALVAGRVQGVFYRASTKELADKLHIQGYAKNLIDGRVEVIALGETANVTELVNWLQSGPRFANVEYVDVEEMMVDEVDFTGFQVL